MRLNIGTLLLGGAAMAQAVACSGATTGLGAKGGAADETSAGSSLPPLEAIAPLTPPDPTLSLVVTAETQTLSALVDAHSPRVIASERGRSLGAPGRVDYRVERGGLTVETTSTSLVVSTPLRGQVTLCKPFGPFCPEYGRCAPRWAVQAIVPWLSDFQSPPEAKLVVAMTRGCVLSPVGLDVSTLVARLTREQTGKVQTQLTGGLKAAHGRATSEYLRLLNTLDSPGDSDAGCLTPTALHYDLRQADERLTAIINAQVELSAQPCDGRSPAAPELIRDADLRPETAFEHWAQVPLPEIEQHLGASLGSPVTLRAGRTAHGDALFMRTARLPSQWFELRVAGRDSQLQFTAAPLVKPSSSYKPPPRLAPLDVPLAQKVSAAARALGRALAEATTADRARARVVVIVAPGVPRQSVRLGPDSVALVTSVATPLVLELVP